MKSASRLRGAVCGASAGLWVALTQAFTAYGPAIAATDHSISLFIVVLNVCFLALVGATAGAIHAGLAIATLCALGFIAGSFGSAAIALIVAAFAARWPRPALVLGALVAAGGTLWVESHERSQRIAAKSESRPDIVLVILDTVAYAHTGFAGLETTPNLLALAKRGIAFERATAAAPWTIPSHASIFTGRAPRTTGAHHESMMLDSDTVTLAETLEQRGYATAAFAANPWIGPVSGLTRGFSHIELLWQNSVATRQLSVSRIPVHSTGKAGGLLVDRALQWLDTGRDAPRFVFINLMEAHAPYAQTRDPAMFGAKDWAEVSDATHTYQTFGPQATNYPESEGQIENARLVYRAAVHEADRVLGRLIHGLEESERTERTVLIVTSDHGEAFGERGFHGHILGLGDETLHVPLVIHDPRSPRAGVSLDSPVGLARLHATILDLAGDDMQRDSLLASDLRVVPVISEQQRPIHFLARFEPHSENAADLSKLDRSRSRARFGSRSVQVEVDPSSGEEIWKSFDLENDRFELHAESISPADRSLSEALRRHRSHPLRRADNGSLEISKDLQRYLEALGYASESAE